MSNPFAAPAQQPVFAYLPINVDIFPLHIAVQDGVVVEATLLSSGDIIGIGMASDTATSITIVNVGNDGTGTTEVARLDFDNTSNVPPLKACTFTLSGTPAHREVTQGGCARRDLSNGR